ncbi:hypothetical protein A4A58_04655 [Tardiphaga robiniae]|uniref:Uncharacterized protein n=1 Tax=Tardiphaga robiniae TaxID=943830 RepID=A0A164B339_9BRAD|nr:hypothetical protein A4A58_04655 [Tardiphaga robiniae]
MHQGHYFNYSAYDFDRRAALQEDSLVRKTVTFTPHNSTEERQFHLEESKAERFASRVRDEGGSATVGPLRLGDDLTTLFTKIGIDPLKIK